MLFSKFAIFLLFLLALSDAPFLWAANQGTSKKNCEEYLKLKKPYEVLQAALHSDSELSEKINDFHQDSLKLNEKYRSGMSRRVIYFLTSNPKKLSEYQIVFHRYGIEVILAPVFENPAYIKALLEAKAENTKVISVMRENSNLYKIGSDVLSSRNEQAENVENRSRLEVYSLEKEGELAKKTYSYTTIGHIDLAKKKKYSKNVFGWDDIFVLDEIGASYHELYLRGIKISSRDMVLGQYLQDFLYYSKHTDLKFNTQAPTQTIDFGKTVTEFIASQPLLNTPTVKKYHLDNLFHSIGNDGVFFRAPINRRQKNYWLPGLNAGIPFVPKGDPIHELTYMVHDLGHARIPDLIYTGNTSAYHRQVYIAYRMMSEALTMVMADMLFVDALARDGIDYDFSKRKIYPLFKAAGIDFSEPKKFVSELKRLMKANALYCLKGDDSAYRELVGNDPKNLAVLENFKDKYMPFFVEDYRWTEKNYSNMSERAREKKRHWNAITAPLVKKLGVQVETIDDFAEKIKSRRGDLVDKVFEEVFENLITPIFENSIQPISLAEQRRNAFFRYMIGQLEIFSKYGFAAKSLIYQNQLFSALTAPNAAMTMESIQEIRSIYSNYIEQLKQLNLISWDDAETYREMYPIFDPFFVYYDGKKESYEDLKTLSERILRTR